MKSIKFFLILSILIGLIITLNQQNNATDIVDTLKTKKDDSASDKIQYSNSTLSHPHFQKVIQQIKEIDLLKQKAQSGQTKEIENRIIQISKDLKEKITKNLKLDFQELLATWIKYQLKDRIKENPVELFEHIDYQPELYKEYLIAIHEAYYPELNYQESSLLLQAAITGAY